MKTVITLRTYLLRDVLCTKSRLYTNLVVITTIFNLNSISSLAIKNEEVHEFQYVPKSTPTLAYGMTQNWKQNTHAYYFSQVKEKSDRTPENLKLGPDTLETIKYMFKYIAITLETGPTYKYYYVKQTQQCCNILTSSWFQKIWDIGGYCRLPWSI